MGVFIFVDPIPQWPEYHHYADRRTIWGIPYALNVLSNLGFLVVGAWGWVAVARLSPENPASLLQWAYLAFFVGLTATAVGSFYYHWNPNDDTLMWDRLPMTVMFMGLAAVVVGETISARAAHRLLLPLLVLGVASVLYWNWTRSIGEGDLRFYGLVQFLPIALYPLMLWWFPPRKAFANALWVLLAMFVLAKACEQFDYKVYLLTGVVSGHTLKHLFGAAAAAALLVLLLRHPNSRDEGSDRYE